jgi:hypothetical protein
MMGVLACRDFFHWGVGWLTVEFLLSSCRGHMAQSTSHVWLLSFLRREHLLNVASAMATGEQSNAILVTFQQE